jgi:hypothetical protein
VLGRRFELCRGEFHPKQIRFVLGTAGFLLYSRCLSLGEKSSFILRRYPYSLSLYRRKTSSYVIRSNFRWSVFFFRSVPIFILFYSIFPYPSQELVVALQWIVIVFENSFLSVALHELRETTPFSSAQAATARFMGSAPPLPSGTDVSSSPVNTLRRHASRDRIREPNAGKVIRVQYSATVQN